MELWLSIIDKIGKKGNLRDMTNLIDALKYNISIGDKYRTIELAKSRNTSEYDYKKQMIKFWERTGIDDGVPPYYLVENLNKNKRMYRTIWSYDIYKNKLGKHVVFSGQTFELVSNINDTLFQDKRINPSCIEYDFCQLSTCSIKRINEHAKQSKKSVLI